MFDFFAYVVYLLFRPKTLFVTKFWLIHLVQLT